MAAGAAGSDTSRTVDDLAALLNGAGKRSRLESLTTLRKAGFTYQPQLVVPLDVDLSCKDSDARSVITGMRTVDWEYALFFGQPLQKECDDTGCVVGAREIIPPSLTQAEWEQLQKSPGSLQSRELLVRRSLAFQRKLLEEARREPAVLTALGARQYGATLEILYISSILVLAAEESDSMPELRKLHMNTFEQQGKILEVLLRDKSLGAHAYFRERAELVSSVLRLLRGKHRLPRAKELAQVLEIIQPERDRYLAPCPR